MTSTGSSGRLPVLLHRGEIVASAPEQDQLLPLLLGAVLERLRELPGPFGALGSPTPAPLEGEGRAVLSVSEAADALGISASLAYRLVREGDLPSVRLGRRLVVPRVAIERVIAAACAQGLRLRGGIGR